MDAASLATFERACAELQSGTAEARQGAEEMLMQMRSSEQAVPAAQFAIQNAASGAGKFQAALILRDAVLRDWGRTPKPERARLRDELLSYTLAQHASLEGFVTRQLLQVVALIVKRGWLDDAPPADGAGEDAAAQAAANRDARLAALAGGSAAASVFERLPPLLGSPDISAQLIGGGLLLALTGEFSFARASAVGLAWEEHARARAGFEMEALQRIFTLALQVLEQHGSAELQAQPRYAEWLNTWAELLSAVLSWDFSRADDAEAVLAGMRRATPSQKGGADSGEVSWLQPGEGWRAALTDGRLIALLFALADKPVGRDGPTGGALEGTPVLAALTSLSSLEGAVFENRTARGAFYNSMLSQSLGRLEQAIAATESGALEKYHDGVRVARDWLTLVLGLFRSLGKYRPVLFTAWDEDEAGAGHATAAQSSPGGAAAAAGAGAVQLRELLRRLEQAAAFALEGLPAGAVEPDALTDLEDRMAGGQDELVLVVLQCWGTLLPPMGWDPRTRPALSTGAAFVDGSAVLRASTAGLLERLVKYKLTRAWILATVALYEDHGATPPPQRCVWQWDEDSGCDADVLGAGSQAARAGAGMRGGWEEEDDSFPGLMAKLGRYALGPALGLLSGLVHQHCTQLGGALASAGPQQEGGQCLALLGHEASAGCAIEMLAMVLADVAAGSPMEQDSMAAVKLADEVVALSLEAEQAQGGCPVVEALQRVHEGLALIGGTLRTAAASPASSPATRSLPTQSPSDEPPPGSPTPRLPFLKRNLPRTVGSPETASPRSPGARELSLSPRLVGVALDAAARLCNAYLGPLDDSRSAMLYPRGIGAPLQQACSCGVGAGGGAVIALYVSLGAVALQTAGLEKVAVTASALLCNLARLHCVRPALLASEEWLGMARGFASGGGTLGSHDARVKRGLGFALATAGLTAEPAEGYLQALRDALVRFFRSLPSLLDHSVSRFGHDCARVSLYR